jgi:hypothetical protein
MNKHFQWLSDGLEMAATAPYISPSKETRPGIIAGYKRCVVISILYELESSGSTDLTGPPKVC